MSLPPRSMTNSFQVFLDANILIYALDETSALYSDVVAAIQRLLDNGVTLCTSHHVIEEVLHIARRVSGTTTLEVVAEISKIPALVLVEPDAVLAFAERYNDIILGGTVQANNWSTEVDSQDTADILRKAKAISPSFDDVEVIEAKVGLRPARDEVRLEVEQFGDKYVIHNYGHGGAGFTLSWGCANDVVGFVKELDKVRA